MVLPHPPRRFPGKCALDPSNTVVLCINPDLAIEEVFPLLLRNDAQDVGRVIVQILIPQKTEIIIVSADGAFILNRLRFPIKNLAYYFSSNAVPARSLDFVLLLSRKKRTDFCRNFRNRLFVLIASQGVLSRYGISLVWSSILQLCLLHTIQDLSQNGTPALRRG